MDCCRVAGNDGLAEIYADEVIQSSMEFDGTQRKPMRIAEANITLGVVAARVGDLERALSYDRQAIAGDRKSIPSLVMVSRDLRDLIQSRYATQPDAAAYLDESRTLASCQD
jgi:hypothetical protein